MQDIELISTGIDELDILLGGGIKSGSVVLLKGCPGSGKTTLATQIMFALAKENRRSMYVSCEQIAENALNNVKSLYYNDDAQQFQSFVNKEFIKCITLGINISTTLTDYDKKNPIIEHKQ